jgi:hypothetical protein
MPRRRIPCQFAANSTARARGTALLAVAAVVLGLTPAVARAQSGWYITPALTLSEEFDDNVFSTPSRTSADFITRFTPSFKAGYQSPPLTVLANGGFDSELFAVHSDLSGVATRKRVGMEFRLLPDHTTTLAMTSTFAQTETPGELQPQLGLEPGRRSTTQWSVAPSLGHRFNLVTSGDLAYSYLQTTSTQSSSFTHEGRAGLSSTLSRLDTGTISYTIRHIETEPEAATTSHTVTAAWTRKLGHTTDISLGAGPRFTGGRIEPDVSASLTHRFKTATISLAYARTETAVIGQTGTSETNSVSTTFSFTPPIRSTGVSLSAGFSNTAEAGGPDTMAYRASASVSYRLTKWLSASLSYRFSVQDRADVRIYHNVVTIGLDASYPIRAY